ncbi:response regulator [Citrifermentans bremense]|uniref:response regulator n=1 Tax=Citrifermentans bremense TaxID=60035 RepID=UPI0003F6E11C|nr:response regulator [Citrifermentans bremense]
METKEANDILLVDDESNVISAIMRGLDDEPYRLTGSTGGKEALQLMEKRTFKVVISDEKMPGMDGAEFLSVVKQLYPETVRIMLTGHASVEATMRAVNKGEIYRFFTKPWNETELKLALRSAVEKYDLEYENRRLLRTVEHQSQELRFLELNYPGISELRRDQDGGIVIDTEVTEEEIQNIIASCNVDR